MNNRMILYLIYFIFGILITAGCATGYELPIHLPDHDVISKSGIDLLWTLNNIYAVQLSPSSFLDASSGNMCFLGAMKRSKKNSINCLNPSDGQIIWQKSSISSTNLLITWDGVYVDTNGVAGVKKYDFKGNLLWSKGLDGTGVENLYIYDNQLQVLLVPEKLIGLDSKNGKIVQEYYKGKTTYIRTDTEVFIRDKGLKAISNYSGEPMWHIQLDQTLNLVPTFTTNIIFIRTGRVIGSIYAIDRNSGKILWQTTNNIISNIAYSEANEKVYVLTLDGSLLAINQEDGQKMDLAEFSSVPFILNGEQDVGGYYLAYDDSLGLLFIIFGDSRQLIAFKVTK